MPLTSASPREMGKAPNFWQNQPMTGLRNSSFLAMMRILRGVWRMMQAMSIMWMWLQMRIAGPFSGMFSPP